MNVQKMDIYVDGYKVQCNYYEDNGYIMIPALFFKHTYVLVDCDREQQSITLKKNNLTITFYKEQFVVLLEEENQTKYDTLVVMPFEYDEKIFVPFQYVSQKLGMSILECSNSHTIKLLTNLSFKNDETVFYKGRANKKRAALTFDDGPDIINTPRILDILYEKKVQATFFVIGQQVRYYPEIFKRIINEGHEVGNHSWSHPNFIELTTAEIKNEIESTEEVIRSHMGRSTSILRPPYGFFAKSDIQIINELGYKVILWSVDTLDWFGLTNEEIISIVDRDLTEGAIILQHCFHSTTGRLDGTVKALPKIIDKLINEGYEIVTVSMLLE
ncbi:polysaccharide deacetylase family protein [Cytobacillus dafuensis]|uniref:Polysaccharide deacetylase family protein n=1 Tax=Cytobacillus dafuensis TaxID=1742359 RepID=A0A5B8Z9U3_CYTDA|nr:polysaccharide deacetylase family protein [Cytobacillus dafuensis]QED49912.1 polysaccharide deacetylase family protein [Cytobacillus dafuensis]